MTEASAPRPNTNRDAPVGSIDMRALQDDGTPYEIWPCHHCLPWHAEVVVDEGEIIVREWHAFDCELFQELLSDD
ncbi:hypothetical protein [Streptomyces sp. NPDC008150]|uniref:hypothetical protein n=1 Tax=Streptomyces sp. NPDC008150 TaxID=3364816 RepID=UPI0036EAE37F